MKRTKHNTLRNTTMAIAMCTLMAQPGTASAQSSDDVLFGVRSDTSELIRHNFDDGSSNTVGTIRSTQSGATLSGIKGSAYIPGHLNIIGFWKDPVDGFTKVVSISTLSAEATVMGQPLGRSPVNGAVAVEPAGGGNHVVNAVQGAVIGEARFALLGLDGTTVNVHGTSSTTLNGDLGIGPNGEQDLDGGTLNGLLLIDPTADNTQTVGTAVSGDTMPQSLNQAVTEYRTLSNGLAALAPTQTFGDITAGSMTIVGNGGLNVISADSIKVNGGGTLTLSGNANDLFVLNISEGITLNGGGTMMLSGGVLPENVIYNVLGTEGVKVTGNGNALTGTFLVPNGDVKVSGDSTVSGGIIGGGGIIEVAGGAVIDYAPLSDQWASAVDLVDGWLIRVDHRTGAVVPVMPLSRVYDSLAATADDRFYATYQDQLYVLDYASGTETLAGSMPIEARGLEFADTTLAGFDVALDRLVITNPVNGSSVGPLQDLGVNVANLETIIFAQQSDLPDGKAGYD